MPTRPASSALRDAGAEILVAGGSTPPTASSALADLGRRGITSLFLEGGRTLAAAFVAAGQLDESRIFVAPMLLVAGRRRGSLARTPRLRQQSARTR